MPFCKKASKEKAVVRFLKFLKIKYSIISQRCKYKYWTKKISIWDWSVKQMLDELEQLAEQISYLILLLELFQELCNVMNTPL